MGLCRTVSTYIALSIFSILTPTKYSWVYNHQLVQIYMSPGIEPGNLIRSTLIRPPPGAVFLNKTLRLQA